MQIYGQMKNAKARLEMLEAEKCNSCNSGRNKRVLFSNRVESSFDIHKNVSSVASYKWKKKLLTVSREKLTTT